jgi:hypothetical protein
MPADEPIRGDGGDASPATLRVDPRHAPFLRQLFADFRKDQLGDLARFADKLRDPEATRALADTCGRIVDGIDRGAIAADGEVRAVLVDVAAATDEGSGYEVAVAEHEAFAHLLAQFDDPHGYRQRVLLRALLQPPSYGGFIADLAEKLGQPEADIRAAAMGLQDKLLATVQDDYVAAAGAAMEFDALWPLAL